ncbi:PREDICTED: tumor necrosis factor receptor superfamily member 14 [Ceratotherium simum simum]|uniref:Tumor necrosis factor receptor superfamily member 14 n=1 Tax=Ceratotherium simum simum TaxID=73337 RepID=A0ABM1CI32_CERSS|nr:PREDICTED: tumor necrosis factor receptor superfamily member 14 [Ceratotherium simum simum]
MEPPRGWGPPPWSPAPKADALSLVSPLSLSVQLCPSAPTPAPGCTPHSPSSLSLPWDVPRCGQTLRPSLGWSPSVHGAASLGALWTLRAAGYRVKQACGEQTGTLCAPCTPGTYTAHLNGLSECLPCRVCDAAMGLVVRRQCSSTENTECGCDQGHFCVSEEGDDCVECRPHAACRPGQRVQERGTEWQDTVCEDCPPGTFSPNGTLGECQPWTKCSGPFETEVKPGTSSTDVTCSSRGLSIFVGVLVGFVFCGLVVFGIWMKIRRAAEGPARVRFFSQWKWRRAEWEVTAAQAEQLMPDVTTVAVEETASMFTERDQHAGQQLQVQLSEKSQTAPAESCQALKG